MLKMIFGMDFRLSRPALCAMLGTFERHVECMKDKQEKSFLALYTLMGLFSSPATAIAQSDWMSCPVIEPVSVNSSSRPESLPPQAVYIEADRALFREQGVSSMSGNVHVSRQDKLLTADQATYAQPEGIVTGSGDVSFSSDMLAVTSRELRYDLLNDQGEMQDAAYYLSKSEGNGLSERVIQQSDGSTRLENSTYTTCPVDEPDWSINAKSIRLNHEQEQGTARNVTLKIRDIPVLYFPWFSFPLTDTRKSGFLWPVIGTSERSGLYLGAPYYLNLAPNYDLTLTPTLLSRRGLQLGGEFRYLTEKNQGLVNLTFLPDDRISDTDKRYYFELRNRTLIGKASSLSLQAEGVSDDQYFTDLGNSLDATSVVNLERRLEYRTGGRDWSFSGMLQNFQVLDGTRPHARLPQLLFRYYPQRKRNGLNLDLESEFTNFADSDTETNGLRMDNLLRVSRMFSTEAAYLKPSVSLRNTTYRLDDDGNTKINRTVPTASLDAGLFFERNIMDGRYTQTLEPRIFYTYTPFREQSGIPVFDSSQRSLSYNQLFAENRFTSRDRIGDANRLSLSLTTRIQSPEEGLERFRASIGQMYYFDDRKVTLPDEPVIAGDRSEIVLEAAGELNDRTRLVSTAFWDTGESEFTAGEMRLRYRDDKERILNIGYAQRKDDFESASLSFAVPVKSGWKAVGSWERDLLNDRNLETVIGAEYESCCWKTRVASRNYLLPDNETRDNAVFVELELKGLGNFGSGTRDLLQDRVYGYE